MTGDLSALVRGLLADGVTPEDLARARRQLGEDADPAAVATHLAGTARRLRGTAAGGAGAPPQIAVCGVDMPARLSQAWDAGGPLWIRRVGIAAGEGTAVAVVGTRRPTLDGRQQAAAIAGDLAAAGIVVVSGLARGIDQAAHRAALDAGGVTTAVIGTGHGVDYPAGTGQLRAAIARSGGVVSEYAPGRGVRSPGQFIARNRILAGLADAVLVVEAGMRSGALSTAGWAQRMGRDVLVVPASPGNPAAAGGLALLVDGATPVRHAADVLDALGAVGRVVPAGVGGGDAAAAGDLDPVAAAVLPLLGTVPASPSALSAATGHPGHRVLVALTLLEERGLAVRAGAGVVRSTPVNRGADPVR